jgi:hypothetical protein
MKSFGLCSIALAFCASPALGAPAGITYDCDTAADHFSELVLPPVGASFVVSGKVQLRTLARSKTFAPLARIQIASAADLGQSPEAFAGFTLSALPVDAKKANSGAPAVQMLSFNFNGRADEMLPLSLMAKPGTAQAFTLSYDDGQVTVSLGNEVRKLPLKAVQPVVRIICSTGEFLFTDLIINPN